MNHLAGGSLECDIERRPFQDILQNRILRL